MRIGTSYGSSPVMRWYISNRFPYLASTAGRPRRSMASLKSRYTPSPPGPTPCSASHMFFAAREAMSRGTRLPNAGYWRSR